MRTVVIKLENLIDIDKWEQLQDALFELTNLSMVLVDYQGIIISKHSGIRSFCQIVRSDKEMSKYCEKCYARGAIEAIRQEKPYYYLCHFNLIDLVIPIMLKNQYIGSIMVGQIKSDVKEQPLKKILDIPNTKEIIERLSQEYEEIPFINLEEMSRLEEMLLQLRDYLLIEAENKTLILQSYQQTLGIKRQKNLFEQKELSLIPLKNLAEEIEVSVVEKIILNDKYKVRNPILQPAVDILLLNKDRMYTLKELSEIVHISSGYLSKLLKEEFGISFSQLYPQIKIEWSKKLLEQTDLHVAEISEKLGFEESSYFIRIFKKREGITPLKYRSIHRR